MASYHVIRDQRHQLPRLGMVVILVLSFVLTAASAPALTTIQVVVDGTEITLPVGSRAELVFGTSVVRSQPGDLLDLTGELLVRGGGSKVVLTRDGWAVEPGDRLFDGDLLSSRPGSDITEEASVITTVVPAPVLYEGSGPLEEVRSQGSTGLAEVVQGAVSGKVTRTTVLTPPQPMVVVRSKPKKPAKAVALTFDDGPWPGQTERILEILAENEVTATFFMIGSLAKRHPDLAKRVAEEGHGVGNHSYSHPNLAATSSEGVERELSRTQTMLHKLTGVKPSWFRAPGGNSSSTVAREAKDLDLRVVTWSVDPQDWRGKRAGVIARGVIEATEPGSVILLHDGGGNRDATIRALPWIIHSLQREGYSFVTLDELHKRRR